MNQKEFRRLCEQDWPAPLEIPSDAPKPWLVAGDAREVRNVMTSDYYAPPRESMCWQTASGPVANVTHRDHVRGVRDGTLFVLAPPGGFSARLMGIIDEARARGFKVRDLPTKRELTE